MEEIKPYTTFEEALRDLDNGGHFYNLFTQAEDDIITQAELSKVSGVFFAKQQMILFLEMALSKLDETEKLKFCRSWTNRSRVVISNTNPNVWPL
ncbi:hypothetical protein [Siphonobacter sp. SORGH_AS_1065]|uniref:hypothetical protein n=1 Tax=Siphonobacter sp. SORGH_AS_1065 TaxID=3041795 RepID=UPI00277E3BDA|nr:hypothetical protein [Siphonobacter sp. SORGH_AS_1065]MDQ1086409.1 hypothetical protein [Siphonobacter sp. SORGH_AS_1065]